jgi:hypothetical protein
MEASCLHIPMMARKGKIRKDRRASMLPRDDVFDLKLDKRDVLER